MPRVLIAVVGLLAIAATLLLLRQQNLRLRHACNVLHAEMFDVEQDLWRQQVQVAAATSPAAIEAVRQMHQAKTQQVPPDKPAGEWVALDQADLADW